MSQRRKSPAWSVVQTTPSQPAPASSTSSTGGRIRSSPLLGSKESESVLFDGESAPVYTAVPKEKVNAYFLTQVIQFGGKRIQPIKETDEKPVPVLVDGKYKMMD